MVEHPVWAFRIGGDSLPDDELGRLGQELQQAFERADVDGELVVFNGDIEPIDKQELIEELG